MNRQPVHWRARWALAQITGVLFSSVVYEDDGRDPVTSVARAVNAMSEAIALLQRVGPLLDDAQAAISRQGYRSAG